MTRRLATLLLMPLLACGSATPEPQTTDASAPLTASQCEARGGTVVGDIGDGAIHRPDYVCPSSGKPPIGDIEPEPGGPIAVEGSVCCM